MILQALTAYYEQLLKQGKVEAPGWDSRFKVSYELRLGPDGQLLALNDLRQEVPKGKKTMAPGKTGKICGRSCSELLAHEGK